MVLCGVVKGRHLHHKGVIQVEYYKALLLISFIWLQASSLSVHIFLCYKNTSVVERVGGIKRGSCR